MGNGVNVYKGAWEQMTREKAFEGYMPQEVCISLKQGEGIGCQPTVLPGEYVFKGQVIGSGQTKDEPSVHASISGYVQEIFHAPCAPGAFETFVRIKKDETHKELWHPFSLQLTREAMTKLLDSIGISRERFLPAKKLIVNGFANEPYITSGYRLMMESPGKIVVGAILAAMITDAQRITLCVNEDAFEAAARLKRAVLKYGKNLENQRPIEVVLMKRRYPQGNEKILCTSLIQQKGETATVLSLAEIAALYDGIYDGEPWTRVGITVAGEVKQPKNLWVPIGTRVKDIIDYCGGMSEQAVVIHGGPLEGHTIPSESFWIRRETSGLLVLKRPDIQESACIHCGLCQDACPKHLCPDEIEKVYTSGDGVFENLRVEECIQCGLCSYVCPSGRRLTEYIGQVKKGRVRRPAQQVKKEASYIPISEKHIRFLGLRPLDLKSQSSPHIHRRGTIWDVMRNSIYGLLPLMIGVFLEYPNWRLHFFMMLIVGILSAGLTEYLWQMYTGHFQTIRDGSAVFTGLLLTLLFSIDTPLWKVALASITAILAGKQIFGGIGYAPIHPVLVGKIVFQPFGEPMIENLWLLALMAILWMCCQRMLPVKYPLVFVLIGGVFHTSLWFSATFYLAAAYFIWSYETMVPTQKGRWIFTVLSSVFLVIFEKMGMGCAAIFFSIAFADLWIPWIRLRNVKRV